MVVPVYPGRTVLRLKFNQKPNLFSFLEIFKAQKFGMGFFEDESFVLEFFFGLCWKPSGFFGFLFGPIPVT